METQFQIHSFHFCFIHYNLYIWLLQFMFESSWSTKLSELPLHASVACLPQPSLVYQGKSNQLSVFIGNQTINLPIRKQIISLATIQNEYVLVLTRYALSCFDFQSNEQRFNKQFQNAERLFVINDQIYVASGTSLYCFNSNGQQQYVNHVSAPITAITNVCSSAPISSQDIIVATTDLTMFRYSKLNIVFDYSKIIGLATSLCWVGKGVMVGTQEGPIAFYQSKKYKWKAKSVHNVLKILRFNEASQHNKNAQFQTQKADKIIVIRVEGNIQLRDWENGATLTKIKAGDNIINSFISDFRKEGVNQILCVLESGMVKAFNLKDQVSQSQQATKNTTVSQTIQKADELQQLNKKKQQLLFQINQLKSLMQNQEKQTPNNQPILRSDFKMTASLDYKEGLILQIQAVNGFISGLIFEQPLMPLLIEKSDKINYKFLAQTHNFGELICQILVHSSLSTTKYQVKKIPIHLPKFWKWGLDPTIRKQINGKLKFKLIERNSRFILWLKQCFYMNISEKDEQKLQILDEIKLRFYNWYDKKQMQIIFNQLNGTVRINCQCLKTMGEIFQDLINYIGIKHLNSQLQFPQEKQNIKKLLETVQKLSQTKMNITNDLADSINTIKFLLVKGESARVVGQMGGFRKTYGEIMQQNRNLITEIEKKNVNTKVLTETLKSVNSFINQIANVRYGQPKNQVIAKCREAIKKKKFPEIFSVMDKGSETGL